MKNLVTFALILLTSIGLSAQKRDVSVGDFTKVSFGVPGTLYISEGNENTVSIEASDEAFGRLSVEVSGGRLRIKQKDYKNWNWKGQTITAYVTIKNLEDLDVSGSGSVEGKGRFDSDDLNLSVSGSGSMELDVNADFVDIEISGSGKIYLDGSADEAEASISGSGKVKAEDFTVDTFEARISGSGSCYITANEEIDARISGSGSVYYKGNPRSVNSNSSGSGKVRKI